MLPFRPPVRGLLARLACRLTVAGVLGAAGPIPGQAQNTQPNVPGTTGLPLPRYVSLKSDRVHARQGPSLDHKVLWVYRRVGLPVEVVREFESWRQIRDSDGAEGWIAQALISQRRTALIAPWDVKGGAAAKIELKNDRSASAAPVAILEAGVIANIRSCDARWCHVSVGDYRGYVEQAKLWGVYPNEAIRP